MSETLTPTPRRLALLPLLKLRSGSHGPPPADVAPEDCEMCFEEVRAWLYYGPDPTLGGMTTARHTDRPDFECPVIGGFLRYWNDAFPETPEGDADRTRILREFLV